VRTYAGRAIPDDALERILEAARRTPSAMNQQAWDFVVVTDARPSDSCQGVWRYAAHVATSAATIALVAPGSDDREARESYQYDLGQATMSIMLAAADQASAAVTPPSSTRNSRAPSSGSQPTIDVRS